MKFSWALRLRLLFLWKAQDGKALFLQETQGYGPLGQLSIDLPETGSMRSLSATLVELRIVEMMRVLVDGRLHEIVLLGPTLVQNDTLRSAKVSPDSLLGLITFHNQRKGDLTWVDSPKNILVVFLTRCHFGAKIGSPPAIMRQQTKKYRIFNGCRILAVSPYIFAAEKEPKYHGTLRTIHPGELQKGIQRD